MTHRTRLSLGILVALGVAAGLGYLLLPREPVYGGKPRSYWKEHLAKAEYAMVPPPGWLAGLVWKVNPWKKPSLGTISPRDTCEASLGLLADMMSDPDPTLRCFALLALYHHYGDSAETWAILLRGTRDPDVAVRKEAVILLVTFHGPLTPAMVEEYQSLLADRDPEVKRIARLLPPRRPELRAALARALQQRAQDGILTADEALLLQELQPAAPAP